MRLRTRLNLQVVFVVTIVIAGLGAYTHTQEKERLIRTMERQVEDATKRLELSLPGPLWNFELQFAVQSIESELESEWLRAVAAFDKSGKLLIGREKQPDGAVIEVTDAPQIDTMRLEQALQFEESPVGTVVVYADDAGVKAKLSELFWFTILEIILLDLVIVVVLALVVARTVIRPLETINKMVSDIAAGRFDNEITITTRDEMGQLLRNLDRTQTTLRDNQERERAIAEEEARVAAENARIAAENARIAAGLQSCRANVMIANNDLEIVYMNDAVRRMMTENESRLQTALSGFRVRDLVGTCVDVFHREPAHQLGIIESLREPYQTELKIAGLTFSLNASPVFDEAGERIGTVVEWQDRTEELARLAKEQAIAAENARIAAGLKVCQANVMIANNDLEIVYMNDTVTQMMAQNEARLQSELPQFQVSSLVGTCVDVFHKEPSHQRGMLESLREPYRTELKIAGLTFNLNASPVFDDEGKRIGTVVEWQDRTEELARLAEEQAIAAENARIAAGLKVCQANVMIANNDLEIVYMNDTVAQMMAQNEARLQSALPQFDAGSLVGTCVDVFHKEPSHQRGMIQALREPYQTELKLAGLTFSLIASPVFDADGARLGTVVEWNDRTEELARQAEERAIAAENARIAAGLKVCQANVMIANNDLEIVYMNDTVEQMMSENEARLQSVLPDFRVSKLVGTCVDVFHKEPSHQRGMIDALREPYQTELKLAGLTFGLTASPVFDTAGVRLGTVVEWNDRTEELARHEEERAIADENRRIRQALDSVSTNAMIADRDFNIIYLNEAVVGMMRNAEQDIRRDLASFSVDKLMGANIDQFHKNPAHQRGLVGAMTTTYRSEISIGGRTFGLVANPINNESGDRIGTVVEWNDRTDEVAIEKEIDGIVQGAVEGDLTRRINLEDKEGFFRVLASGLNQLVDVCQNVIEDVQRVLGGMARGDLTQGITADYKGQFDRLKSDTNTTIANLTDILGQISDAAGSVSSGADEMAQGNADLSQRTEEQASALEETASSMEEMTATVRTSAENARTANELSVEARDKAQRGGEVVTQAVEAMQGVDQASKKIADIIGVIDEIAFQTNLLALNAAVEAARAGEQGRGFAVVAGEVRNLAQRSAAAAREIKDLIRDSGARVKEGSRLVNESGNTLQEIVVAVRNVSETIAQIADSAQEQTQGIDQVNRAVGQMDEMTQQNAALVEQASASSESMAEQARNMSQLVSFFTLAQEQGSGGQPATRGSSHGQRGKSRLPADDGDDA